MPYAELMVEAADAAGLDWRLMPAIAVHESSAGRAACGGNFSGLGSCGPGYVFATWEEGIRMTAETLSKRPYTGLGTREQLCMWVSGNGDCPSHSAQEYAERVMATMEAMGPE